ncbi:MAG: hypothetical protein ACYDDF_04645 [Thermoplasmatota archaeon]
MKSRVFVPVVCLLTLATSFAGCLGLMPQNGGTTITQSTTSNSNPLGNNSLVMPDNRTGDMTAYNETNVTDSMGMHAHDYWAGRTRVTLFTEHVIMQPPNSSGTEVTYRPPYGALVYEGTGEVDITISNPMLHACDPNGDTLNGYPICTDTASQITGINAPAVNAPDPQPSTSLKLQYLTAASDPNAWTDAGPLSWNTPLVIKITDPKQTDMPHSTGSLWAFRILSTDPKDGALEFDITATIIRGPGAIPLWPGHPLFYAKGHYRLIYDDTGARTDGPLPSDTQSFQYKNSEARLISAGTNTLIVFANITSYTTPVPTNAASPITPDHFLLQFHNASWQNWNITSVSDPDHAVGKTSYKWIIKVDPNGMDTPYATASRWAFFVAGATNGCYGGCASFKVTYKLTIIASDLVAPKYDVAGRG